VKGGFAEEPDGLSIVGNLEGELLGVGQARVEASTIATGERRARVGEGRLGDGVGDVTTGEEESDHGPIGRGDIRGVEDE